VRCKTDQPLKKHVSKIFLQKNQNETEIPYLRTQYAVSCMDINYESVDSTLPPDKLKLRIFANDRNITEDHVSFIPA
jgi:hypothetical protein